MVPAAGSTTTPQGPPSLLNRSAGVPEPSRLAARIVPAPSLPQYTVSSAREGTGKLSASANRKCVRRLNSKLFMSSSYGPHILLMRSDGVQRGPRLHPRPIFQDPTVSACRCSRAVGEEASPSPAPTLKHLPPLGRVQETGKRGGRPRPDPPAKPQAAIREPEHSRGLGLGVPAWERSAGTRSRSSPWRVHRACREAPRRRVSLLHHGPAAQPG